MSMAYDEACAERDALRAEVEALRQDKARLDWLEQNYRHIGRIGPGGPWVIDAYAGMGEWIKDARAESLRAAIDAAMKEPKP